MTRRPGFQNVGAWYFGEEHVGPIRGDGGTTGKAGGEDNPRINVPVFHLTHHDSSPPRELERTTFHFIRGGIGGARRAREALTQWTCG